MASNFNVFNCQAKYSVNKRSRHVSNCSSSSLVNGCAYRCTLFWRWQRRVGRGSTDQASRVHVWIMRGEYQTAPIDTRHREGICPTLFGSKERQSLSSYQMSWTRQMVKHMLKPEVVSFGENQLYCIIWSAKALFGLIDIYFSKDSTEVMMLPMDTSKG